jgi:putative ABC transport system substrate-binding protein
MNVEVAPKRLELLRELLPKARVFARLANPTSPTFETQSKSVSSAAQTLGLDLHVFNASTERDFDGVFTKLIQLRASGLVIDSDSFFTGRQEQLAALSVRHAVPAVYENREFAAAGGLASYGGVISDAYRLVGIYAARILKGEKPGELPVQQSTKVELFLNLKTARTLGIAFPLTLLGRADAVIE